MICATDVQVNRHFKIIQISTFVATITATLATAVGNVEWVPALIAAAAAFRAMNEYHQLEQIIPITNAAIKSLEGMKAWWSSRSMVEKRMPVFRCELAEKSEDAILNQIGAWFAVMQASSPSEDLTKEKRA